MTELYCDSCFPIALNPVDIFIIMAFCLLLIICNFTVITSVYNFCLFWAHQQQPVSVQSNQPNFLLSLSDLKLFSDFQFHHHGFKAHKIMKMLFALAVIATARECFYQRTLPNIYTVAWQPIL